MPSFLTGFRETHKILICLSSNLQPWHYTRTDDGFGFQ